MKKKRSQLRLNRAATLAKIRASVTASRDVSAHRREGGNQAGLKKSGLQMTAVPSSGSNDDPWNFDAIVGSINAEGEVWCRLNRYHARSPFLKGPKKMIQFSDPYKLALS